MELKYTVQNEKNLYNILKDKLHISSRLYERIRKEYIYVNDLKFDYKTILHQGDVITIKLDYEEDNSNIVANKDIDLNILYEDEWMLIVDKQAGIPVHPSIAHYDNSLSNGVKYYFDQNNIHKKIRPVNRLDKNTSGIVIFAKNEYIQDNITINLKEYIAIVRGKLPNNQGIIDKPIKRKDGSIIERCIDSTGERAVTHYQVLDTININNLKNHNLNFELSSHSEENNIISVVKCILETGRTHQIRVHLASLGNPILGDDLYGEKSSLISRQALHCYHLKFIHPITKQEHNITSPIPYDFKFAIHN